MLQTQQEYPTTVKEGHPEASAADAQCFTLSTPCVTVEVTSLGASLSKFILHEKEEDVDIVLGYPTVSSQETSGNPMYFSGIVGRVANRIANGKFSLIDTTTCNRDKAEETVFRLECNENNTNHLHGGNQGFSHVHWKGNGIRKNDHEKKQEQQFSGSVKPPNCVQFQYNSPDGDQGYPGRLLVTATYSLTTTRHTGTASSRDPASYTASTLTLELEALLVEDHESSSSTPVDLTSHAYFNLGGSVEAMTTVQQKDEAAAGNGILDHTLHLASDAYLPLDGTSVPTGQVVQLETGADSMDFCQSRRIGDALLGLDQTKEEASLTELRLKNPLNWSPFGIDHYYFGRQYAEKTADNHTSNRTPRTGVGATSIHSTPRPATANMSTMNKMATLTYKHRTLEVSSTAPGLQVYTGNYLGHGDGSDAAADTKVPYGPWSGICFEAQHVPNSVNAYSSGPSTSADQKLIHQAKCPILTQDHPIYRQCIQYTIRSD